MRLLAIDPGANTGLAVFWEGKLVSLDTVTPYGLIDYLHGHLTSYDLVAIEDSRCQSALFSAKDETVHAKALKIARDVGRIDALCALVQEACGAKQVAHVAISPRTKGEKLNAAEFKAVTGWDGKSNQHERDSALVGWMFRHTRPAQFYRKQGDLVQEFGTRRGRR
jgi:hypothetical protein